MKNDIRGVFLGLRPERLFVAVIGRAMYSKRFRCKRADFTRAFQENLSPKRAPVDRGVHEFCVHCAEPSPHWQHDVREDGESRFISFPVGMETPPCPEGYLRGLVSFGPNRF